MTITITTIMTVMVQGQGAAVTWLPAPINPGIGHHVRTGSADARCRRSDLGTELVVMHASEARRRELANTNLYELGSCYGLVSVAMFSVEP